ncbi:MAG: CYTH domain-containing protein [Anaerostipes sp.]|nr:CYTH domain-containing protein [Anaerostipes sp.]
MEIERKFLVTHIPDNIESYPHSEIEQGYLCMEPVVRIRKKDNDYILTYKSKGLLKRSEHEFPLSKQAYEHMLTKIDGNRITKTRYRIPTDHELTIELDVFHENLEGLVMAEVEFPSEEDALEYEGPDWFEDEVTFDRRYQNNNLANK